METCDEKDAAVLVAQKDPRVLSSHARHGSCAGRRVDGAKLASGAVAAVFATLGRYGRRLLGRRVTQKGDSDDRRDHFGGGEWW